MHHCGRRECLHRTPHVCNQKKVIQLLARVKYYTQYVAASEMPMVAVGITSCETDKNWQRRHSNRVVIAIDTQWQTCIGDMSIGMPWMHAHICGGCLCPHTWLFETRAEVAMEDGGSPGITDETESSTITGKPFLFCFVNFLADNFTPCINFIGTVLRWRNIAIRHFLCSLWLVCWSKSKKSSVPINWDTLWFSCFSPYTSYFLLKNGPIDLFLSYWNLSTGS